MLGYCTNVHAGTTLAEVRANLERYALAVKRRFSPDAPMGIGLWLAYDAAVELLQRPEALADFKAWLDDAGLVVFTFNGFPYGAFHGETVKHRVYEPDWTTKERYEYTLTLATLLTDLLPEGGTGSISTLPLGWPSLFCGSPEAYDGRASAAAERLTDLVHMLARMELDSGKCVHIDLEPEPGCILERSSGLVHYFQQYLLGTPDDTSVLGYLRVCHDVCHAAVVFEDQAEAFEAYRGAGIAVGKVQVSSALDIDFGSGEAGAKLDALRRFEEPRYLHQTCVSDKDEVHFYEDLPIASEEAAKMGRWRVHFHVPVHLERIGELGTTRGEIDRCLAAIQPSDGIEHFEVETYAWGVLPEEHRVAELADGIAAELAWVRGRMWEHGLADGVTAGGAGG